MDWLDWETEYFLLLRGKRLRDLDLARQQKLDSKIERTFFSKSSSRYFLSVKQRIRASNPHLWQNATEILARFSVTDRQNIFLPIIWFGGKHGNAECRKRGVRRVQSVEIYKRKRYKIIYMYKDCIKE